MADAAPPGASKGPGVFDDVLEIFTAPSRVFERRRDAGFGKPLLVLTLLLAAATFATLGAAAPFWDAQYLRAAEEAAREGREMPTTAQALTFARYAGAAAQLIFVPLFSLLGGLFVLLGARIAGLRISYRQGTLAFVFAGFPRLIDTLALAVQGLVLDPVAIRGITDGALGPVRFFDPETTNAVLLGLLANLSLGTVWGWILIAIGMRVFGRTSLGTAAFGTFLTFVLFTGLTLIPSALF